MEKSEKNVIYISKLDAAKRQMETALRLFFNNGDIVSIHTLISAAYDIMKDLCDKKDLKGYFVKDTSIIKKERQKDYIDMINKSQNFFKHADKDHKKLLGFRQEMTEYFLLDASNMYYHLTSENTPYIQLYRIWFIAKYPDMIEIFSVKNEYIKESLKKELSILDPNNRPKFLEWLPSLNKI